MAEHELTASRPGPLHAEHAARGAKFGDFGGWSMPLEYAGGGVVAEHTAVRERVGVFDVSHMGTFTVRGPGAVTALNEIFTNDLNRVRAGQAQYSLLCSQSGGVIDDLLVYVVGDDEVLVVPNASNTAMVVATVERVLAPHGDLRVADISGGTAILAVQGPRSTDVLNELELPTDLDYMTFTRVADVGDPVWVARSGYTGEHGYELILPVDTAPEWWQRILAAFARYDGLPCGLGARDTLRTEMGYPLHGHELTPQTSPLVAGLGWAIGWDKPAFIGKSQLVAKREAGQLNRLRGLRCLERGIPRPGMVIRSVDGDQIGYVTSGTFSPTRKAGIALAVVGAGFDLGTEVSIEIRGRSCRAEIVRPPFVDADPRR